MMNFNFPPLAMMLAEPIPILTSWVIGAFFAVFMPVILQNNAKKSYYNSYGYYIEYENQQRDQNEGNNNNNNNYYYMKPCKWYQFQCRRQNYLYREQNEGGNDNNNQQQQLTPAWYQYMGGVTEEDDRMREEMGLDRNTTSGALKFVYVMTLLLFLGVLFYGGFVLFEKRRNHILPLIVLLLVMAQFCFLNMLLLGQGVISSDERDLEDSVYGWYGQFSVFMVYADFWFFLFGIFFACVLSLRVLWQRHQEKKQQTKNYDDSDRVGDYHAAQNDWGSKPDEGDPEGRVMA